ncbi:MAG: deoxyguanosinetriphosphate triphosphohydrolase [Desulfobacterales bacterium]|nr:deoxyguanosinetriphosphate triphosphohydrolase [Desulfobacteraceae bacterium]MBT4364215.1 deoxyguanosinetriphosphate triphosphohydrolase [Desulfobacteraceae bacterium]MBT7086133.1 deoxyguanosinetriphosphate triphosphohydrolase [Desulfobacterales bacterium]MBT7698430.1 deoxyguanosinetriphosphate triphosphohydrolase [Desulfobacterales bacterium]
MIKKMNKNIREKFESREKKFMSPFGCLSSESMGREKEESPCPIRTAFQRDRDRIVYSYAFRQLKHKTQVFLSPFGDQYRTRLTHTLEVAQIARTIARAMRLNEDLAEAIALGHDLGHTPFGHSGEAVLKEVYSSDFSHHKQGLRVVEFLEKNGEGLNLTHEVRDGIVKHSKGFGEIMPDDPEEIPFTMEGKIVRIADIIAYLNHDIDDAIRCNVITMDQIPEVCQKTLGMTHSDRATTMVRDLVYSSISNDNEINLKMSSEVFSAMTTLREFLYENVYRSKQVHKEFEKSKKILSELYYHLLGNSESMQKELSILELSGCYHNHTKQPVSRVVCDVIASMTDRYALNLYSEVFFPSSPV